MRITNHFRLILLLAALAPAASGQLAITEAMSNAANTKGTNTVVQFADYWELTNFGTNDIALDGYKWNDNQGGLIGADPTPFTNLVIHAGESIIFAMETPVSTTNAQQFLDWWGPSVSPNLQIRFYLANGLSSAGDGIRLWSPTATTDADVVDSVDFGAAPRGQAFAYVPTTGVFGVSSTNGVDGAFMAVQADDVGSPGITTGPVPLFWMHQPASLATDPGLTVKLVGQAGGLPRAHYQWLHDNMEIPGETSTNLTITDVQFADAGEYVIRADNGLASLVSTTAVLTVNGAPAPPVIVAGPSNLALTIGQTAVFSITASGNPIPTVRWYFNGNLIGGQSGFTFTIPSVAVSDNGLYSVTLENPSGTASNAATLVVTPKPNLVITEVMSSESTNSLVPGHNDWWELTNLDDHDVSIQGYRWDDTAGTIAGAYVITNAVVIKPGESVVLVENMTRDKFVSWWGSINLSANLQVITYTGNGLSSLGDEINLWNATATDENDKIASEVFSTATPGVSFGYDPDTQTFGDLSMVGVFGAFVAAESDDIGSPGYIRNPPPKIQILSIVHDALGATLTWTTVPGTSYKLQRKNNLDDADWASVGEYPATGATLTETDDSAVGQPHRFYRIEQLP